VLIGFGLLTSPYWVMRRAKRTCYVLTDQRAIVWRAGWFGSVDVRFYTGAALTRMHRRERRDGSGDLIFEEITSVGQNTNGARTSHTSAHGFMAIEKVREIEALIWKALLAKQTKSDN
jgi:hypothetical protein